MKKYEFTGETWNSPFGKTLHRIRAIRSFGSVIAGEEGGWIENEANLSHEGDSWISGEATVCDNARVYENARVSGMATIRDNALVYGDSGVSGEVWINDYARICGFALLRDYATIYDNVKIAERAMIAGHALISENAYIHGNASVYGNARISGDAQLFGDVRVYGNAYIKDKAFLESNNHYLCVSPIGSRSDTVTFTRSVDGTLLVCTGCFNGTIDKFAEKVKRFHDNNKHAKAYNLAIELAKLQIELE